MQTENTAEPCLRLNPEFEPQDCTYSHQDKAVIFSPFTQETVLCESSALQLLNLIAKSPSHKLNASSLDSLQGADQLIDKFIAMRILLKE